MTCTSSPATCPHALVREERDRPFGPSVRPVSMVAEPNGADPREISLPDETNKFNFDEIYIK